MILLSFIDHTTVGSTILQNGKLIGAKCKIEQTKAISPDVSGDIAFVYLAAFLYELGEIPVFFLNTFEK